MRYEGTMQVMGFIDIVVDEPGMTLEEAKKAARANPERYKAGYVESIVFETWETDLVKTEDDEAYTEDEEEAEED